MDRAEKPIPNLALAVLERVFPRTCQSLLESELRRVVEGFSRGGILRELPRFADFLRERKWPSGRGYVPDLAELEHALQIVALAPEIERVGFEGVNEATEPAWYGARFGLDPGHRVLHSEWPLERIFAQPGGEFLKEAGIFLVFRAQGKPSFRPLSQNEAQLLEALALGVPLGRILERPNGPDFDARLFQRWVETGLLRAIHWSPV